MLPLKMILKIITPVFFPLHIHKLNLEKKKKEI